VAAGGISAAGAQQQQQQWPAFRLLDRQLLLLLVPTLVDMAGAALLNIGVRVCVKAAAALGTPPPSLNVTRSHAIGHSHTSQACCR
jgi:hypothetical protein